MTDNQLDGKVNGLWEGIFERHFGPFMLHLRREDRETLIALLSQSLDLYADGQRQGWIDAVKRYLRSGGPPTERWQRPLEQALPLIAAARLGAGSDHAQP